MAEPAVVVAAGRVGLGMKLEGVEIADHDARRRIVAEQRLLNRLGRGLLAQGPDPGFDLDCRFGAVGEAVIDWSGNCGNLSAAVGVFGLIRGLVAAPADRVATLRIWPANLGQTILAHLPVQNGQPVDEGDDTRRGIRADGQSA